MRRIKQSSTGKELVPEPFMQKGLRHERPFIAVNCAAIAPELFGSEFFGHTRGLSPERTKTVAEGGTIFLDQVVSG